MSGVNIRTIISQELQLGNCEFEQGGISLGGGVTIKAGTILKRADERKFAIAEDTDTFVAVVPFDMTNPDATDATLGFRAIISGRVRRDMLNINGATPITSAQADNLRANGNIIAVETTDISRVSPK